MQKETAEAVSAPAKYQSGTESPGYLQEETKQMNDISEWIPGENCDVILSHYNHDPIPLVCYRIQSDPIGPRVKTQECPRQR